MVSIGYSAMFGQDPMCMNQPYFTQPIENPPETQPFTNVQPQLDGLNTMGLKSLKAASDEQAAAVQLSTRFVYMLPRHLRIELN